MEPRFCDARDVGRRVLVSGVLELRAPCHLGGSEPDATSDRPIARDAAGRPFLPGATLAGLLREVLEVEDAERLFGGAPENERGEQSRLIVDDAVVVSPTLVPTELRDGVRIESATGTAADKTKFDLELLPAGTQFGLRFQLDLPGDKGPNDKKVIGCFLQALVALENRQIRLGARTTRGFGDCAVSRWTVTDFETRGEAGLLAWLGSGLEQGLPPGWPRAERVAAPDTRALARALGCSLPSPATPPATRITLELEVAGSLIIRSGGHDTDDADSTHLGRLEIDAAGGASWQPVIPGTSLAGVLRHRCLRIAKTLANGEAAAEDLVSGMFGELSRASRVRVAEAVIEGGQVLRHTRVRIDPWTGGALEGFLFTEDAWYGGSVRTEIELRPPRDADARRSAAERALLLLALRDLACGDLAVGGESGIGRGRFRPPSGAVFATVEQPNAQLRLLEDGTVAIGPEGALDFEQLRGQLGMEG